MRSALTFSCIKAAFFPFDTQNGTPCPGAGSAGQALIYAAFRFYENRMTGGSKVAEKPVALELKNISKSFGSVAANHQVSLKVREGEILSILGENGSGKTTLMNMI